ncbi:major facilitator superfamily domain-containing protein [Zychaea mexicana]|uniref:major facilitator superfamily domain-containing protein n=1 Tax=Zychaea mexicana TaxID=64656 RepID=UPI0022FE0A24|nr:major facilitator superfamily domain-containing protein [Zychaea mexicana]KAI9490062.1 major facilitator superfamily domain-containing protein [Zychaea mexicana]
MKSWYNVNQSIVSIVFLCYAAGFAIAAVLNGLIIKKLSQSKTIAIGATSLVIGFVMLLMAPPFPVLCIFYAFVGFGVALTQSGANVVVGELPNATMTLNFLHASFGLGALIGPLIASALLQYRPWNYTYLVLSSFAVVNLITSIFSSGTTAVSSLGDQDQQDAQRNALSQVIRYPIAYVGAFFLLVYVGIEVTIGDWAYTFLITERSHDQKFMSHLMSCYWAGITAGRLILGYVTMKLGEKRMIYVYIAILIGMCVVFWVIPIVAVDAVALVLSGFVLGPLFPTILSVAKQSVPCHLYATTVGFLSAFGSGGSALFPYITGVLIGAVGVKAMPPLTLAMSTTIFIAWFFIPNPEANHRSLVRKLAAFIFKRAQ